MNDLVISTSAEDAATVDAIRAQHAHLAGGLHLKVAGVVEAFGAGHDLAEARQSLVEWCSTQLVTHAVTEEAALYPAALRLPAATLLVEALVNEHQSILDLVDELRHSDDPVQTVRAAAALRVVLECHVAKEDDQLLPALAEASEISLLSLLENMHAQFGEDDSASGIKRIDLDSSGSETTGACGCRGHDAIGDPELDATVVPHAIRHATIFGALDAVQPGAGLVLIAPHDPLPLLAQLERRNPGAFSVDYLQRGPETWRLRFARNGE